jgi:hypothetical protein
MAFLMERGVSQDRLGTNSRKTDQKGCVRQALWPVRVAVSSVLLLAAATRCAAATMMLHPPTVLLSLPHVHSEPQLLLLLLLLLLLPSLRTRTHASNMRLTGLV